MCEEWRDSSSQTDKRSPKDSPNKRKGRLSKSSERSRKQAKSSASDEDEDEEQEQEQEWGDECDDDADADADADADLKQRSPSKKRKQSKVSSGLPHLSLQWLFTVLPLPAPTLLQGPKTAGGRLVRRSSGVAKGSGRRRQAKHQGWQGEEDSDASGLSGIDMEASGEIDQLSAAGGGRGGGDSDDDDGEHLEAGMGRREEKGESEMNKGS